MRNEAVTRGDRRSPRDRFITVYGRMPVLEALHDERLAIGKVVLARHVHGASVDEIVAQARRRGVRLDRASGEDVTRISRNGRHDQGVVADVEAPGMAELDAWLAVRRPHEIGGVLVLDGITNPANVGMMLRSAAAFGFATVLPRVGVPDLGPLVVKASAGVAFFATVLRAPTAVDAVSAIAQAGVHVVGLAARAESARTLFDALPHPAAFVLGGETDGVSPAVAGHVAEWRTIPMAGGVESLNVAVAAGVVCAEAARQRA
jgi:23S rRNA (guanosine2251-2'-O)-methyltransferase